MWRFQSGAYFKKFCIRISTLFFLEVANTSSFYMCFILRFWSPGRVHCASEIKIGLNFHLDTNDSKHVSDIKHNRYYFCAYVCVIFRNVVVIFPLPDSSPPLAMHCHPPPRGGDPPSADGSTARGSHVGSGGHDAAALTVEDVAARHSLVRNGMMARGGRSNIFLHSIHMPSNVYLISGFLEIPLTPDFSKFGGNRLLTFHKYFQRGGLRQRERGVLRPRIASSSIASISLGFRLLSEIRQGAPPMCITLQSFGRKGLGWVLPFTLGVTSIVWEVGWEGLKSYRGKM